MWKQKNLWKNAGCKCLQNKENCSRKKGAEMQTLAFRAFLVKRINLLRQICPIAR